MTVPLRVPAGLHPEQAHEQAYRLMVALLDARRTERAIRDVRTASDADRGVITVELVVAADSVAAAGVLACAVLATMTEYPMAAAECVALS